jgi:hypothetical protein
MASGKAWACVFRGCPTFPMCPFGRTGGWDTLPSRALGRVWWWRVKQKSPSRVGQGLRGHVTNDSMKGVCRPRCSLDPKSLVSVVRA